MTITRAQLPKAIRVAMPYATLVVPDAIIRELGERAADRMGRSDLRFTVEPKMKQRSEK